MLSFSQFTQAIRNPSYSIGPAVPAPNTVGTLRKAVRTYHQRGVAAAEAALREGLSGYFSRPGAPSTKADVARDLFARYLDYDLDDGRPAFDTDIEPVVSFAGNDVKFRIDVGLLGEHGYVGRVILWDTTPCSERQAAMIACGCAIGFERAMGSGRIDDIQVWHLRTEKQYVVPYREAVRLRTQTTTRIRELTGV
jgi:hypothetical protein